MAEKEFEKRRKEIEKASKDFATQILGMVYSPI
jgi:galactokinase